MEPLKNPYRKPETLVFTDLDSVRISVGYTCIGRYIFRSCACGVACVLMQCIRRKIPICSRASCCSLNASAETVWVTGAWASGWNMVGHLFACYRPLVFHEAPLIWKHALLFNAGFSLNTFKPQFIGSKSDVSGWELISFFFLFLKTHSN